MKMDTRRNADGSLTVGIIEDEIIIPEVKKEPKEVKEVKKVEPKAEPKPAKGRPKKK